MGFSQTNSHLGLGHKGLEHFQSQTGSAQTASHSGLGTWQWVTQWGGLQMLTHLGQSIISQALSGHMGLQSGLKLTVNLSHFTSQIAALGSRQEEWHFGGSHTGVHTASQRGSSHFQEHSGWHF